MSTRGYVETSSLACGSRSFSSVTDSPNTISLIIDDQEAAVRRNGELRRRSPHRDLVAVTGKESGHEVLIAAHRSAVLERDTNDFVAVGFVIGTRGVKCHERVALITRWKLLARIE